MITGHLPEIIIILVIALIFLGPKRLPEAGRSLGQAIRGFRHETQGLRDEIGSIKDDTTNLKSEVTGIRDTVNTTVHESVAGEPRRVAVGATTPAVAEPAAPVASVQESNGRLPE